VRQASAKQRNSLQMVPMHSENTKSTTTTTTTGAVHGARRRRTNLNLEQREHFITIHAPIACKRKVRIFTCLQAAIYNCKRNH